MVKALKIQYTTHRMQTNEYIPSYIVYLPERGIGFQMIGKEGQPLITNAREYFDFFRTNLNSDNGGMKPEEIEVSERYVQLIDRIYEMRKQRRMKEGVLAA